MGAAPQPTASRPWKAATSARAVSGAGAEAQPTIVYSQQGRRQEQGTADIARASTRTSAYTARAKKQDRARIVDSASTISSTVYWIQLLSASSRERVESARLRLTQYQVEGWISEHTVNDTRYYRLRVGPYYNYLEAKKFLAWFKQGAVSDDGYVVQAHTQR